MAYTVLIAFIVAVAMTTSTLACSTPLSTYQFRRLYCRSQIVFRGTTGQATSGVYRDQDGNRIEVANFWFHVDEWFRGGNDLSETEIKVTHQWRQGVDTCARGAFPDHGIDFLVFASADDDFSNMKVETCRHSFPWDCVPDSFKDNLHRGHICRRWGPSLFGSRTSLRPSIFY